jgi:hypothetical protein
MAKFCRANFTYKEFQPTEMKIVNSMTIAQSASVFAAMDQTSRTAFYNQAGGLMAVHDDAVAAWCS